jgi:tetratricopeptide (TPR) repeat protein
MNRSAQNGARSILSYALVAALALASASCSKLASRERHLKKADQYFAQGKYGESEIEYKNALQGDPLNARAIGRLGIIYYEQGSIAKAIPFLLKGHQLDPDSLELRIKLGQISAAKGEFKDAREEALFILDRDPRDPEAPVLLAEVATTPKEIAEAQSRIEKLTTGPEKTGPILVAMANLEFKQKNPDAAEASLRKALSVDPKSSSAEFALGTLLWLKNDKAGADQALGAAASLAPVHSQIPLKYARFKIQTGDRAAARKALEDITKNTPDFVSAAILLAQLDLTERQFDAANAAVTNALQRDSGNPEAMLLSAQISLGEGKSQKAITELNRLQVAFPNSPAAPVLLGETYLLAGDTEKAVTSLNQAIAINPNQADAILLLARANIRKGEFKEASVSLTQLLKKRPDIVQAHLLLAAAYRGQGNFDGALRIAREMAKAEPKDPEMVMLPGLILLEMNRREEARVAFEATLALSPGYFPASEQLINVDIAEKKYPAALQRANEGITNSPKSALPELMLAKVYLAENDKDRAEAALLKAIQLEPEMPAGYFLLAELYDATHRQDKALENLQAISAKNPKDTGALMMTGVIYDSQKNYTAARVVYEKILTINPRFSSALNNLAYLYSEKFNQLDKGFEMAQRARELLPNEPHAADTLGWILYKRHQYPWALGLIQESASALPSEAEVQYHLGMAQYMMGRETPAKVALERALRLQADFSGSDDARQRLSVLSFDPVATSGSARSAAEQSLEKQADDPVALGRLASMYERDGSIDKAVAKYQAALDASPSNVATMLNLIRLYSSQQDPAKAMDLAKKVHQLAPNDPDVSHTLGLLAFRTADYKWAYSLLHETVDAKPEDASVSYEFALSAFSVGKLPEAEQSMRRAIDSGLTGGQLDEAKSFLSAAELLRSPNLSALPVDSVGKTGGSDTQRILALDLRGGIQEAKHDPVEAARSYEAILAQYPDFIPAKRRLAVLYSEDPSKASDLARSALESFPSDPDIDRALGMVAYRKSDYARAAILLQESSERQADDPKTLYYLGMSRIQLKNAAAGRRALQTALNLGLPPELAASARTALAAK